MSQDSRQTHRPPEASSELEFDEDRIVYVVDDDEGMRRSLRFMLEDAGYRVRTFDAVESFLEQRDPEAEACLLLDMRMPSVSGMELVERLHAEKDPMPVIVLTGHGDVPTAAAAMRQGVVDFLEKPAPRPVLLARISEALEAGAVRRERRRLTQTLGRRLEKLTEREHQILRTIADGWSSKQIADQLEISENTVNNHRARIMNKVGAVNTAELVRIAVSARMSGEQS